MTGLFFHWRLPSRVLLCKGKRKVAFAAKFAVHFQYGFSEENISSAACKFGSDFTKVSRADDILELDIVDAGVKGGLALDLIF